VLVGAHCEAAQHRGDILGGRRKKRRAEQQRERQQAESFDFGEDFFEDELEVEEDGFFDSLQAVDDVKVAKNKDESASYAEYLSASNEYFPNPYCDMVESMETVCMENSILELWANGGKYDMETDMAIAELTREKILDRLNSVNVSGVFLVKKNFSEFLSGVK